MEDKEILEPEEVSSGFNPLDAAVNEKSYTKPNVSFDASEINTPIPEPVFMPPPMNKETEEKKEKKPIEPFNEQLNDLPNKDKAQSSEQMATMILDGYSTIFNFVEQNMKIKDGKVRKLELEGEVDLSISVPFPTETGETIQLTFREFIEQFNSQVDGTLKTSDEFKREVKPVLVRVLQKKGIGLTDEQMLIYLFSKDIITKGVAIFALRSSVNQMMEMMKETTLEYKRYNSGTVPPPPPAQAAPYNPPPPPTTPSPVEYTPTEVVENFDFEDEQEQEQDVDDMPDWAKPAPTANDIVNQMTNPEGLGMAKKPKRTKKIK